MHGPTAKSGCISVEPRSSDRAEKLRYYTTGPLEGSTFLRRLLLCVPNRLHVPGASSDSFFQRSSRGITTVLLWAREVLCYLLFPRRVVAPGRHPVFHARLHSMRNYSFFSQCLKVNNLIESFLEQARTIILCVIPANQVSQKSLFRGWGGAVFIFLIPAAHPCVFDLGARRFFAVHVFLRKCRVLFVPRAKGKRVQYALFLFPRIVMCRS